MDQLHIIQLVVIDHHHQHLSIWTLVDYKQSIWKKQEHDPISFTDHLPCDFIVSTQQSISDFRPQQEKIDRILYPQPLCSHPYNPLLVYFCLPESIVSLDVAARKLHLITRLSKRGTYCNQYDKVIPMTMHLHPFLVPDHGKMMKRIRPRSLRLPGRRRRRRQNR
ncbi:unnamed protein product [Cochlearia groenlandica]